MNAVGNSMMCWADAAGQLNSMLCANVRRNTQESRALAHRLQGTTVLGLAKGDIVKEGCPRSQRHSRFCRGNHSSAACGPMFRMAWYNEERAFLSRIQTLQSQDIDRIEIIENTAISQPGKMTITQRSAIDKFASDLRLTVPRDYKLSIEKSFNINIYLNNEIRIELYLAIDRSQPAYVALDGGRWPGGMYKNSALVDWASSLFGNP